MLLNRLAPFAAVAALHALLGLVAAQTYTSCNPLNSTCPPDPALGTTFKQTFSSGSSLSSDYWKIDAGPSLSFGDSGADFAIYGHGDSPTIQSNYYIFWGRVEVIMKAAAGQGIISSIVLLSDDLDEIDWEVMGGNTTYIETNYYGKGNVSQINSEYFPCDGPQESFHNYTTVWTSEQIEWHLDGTIVRTLPYSQAVQNGNTIYPQTPCYLKLGSWAGGDPSEPPGTIAWAGGQVNYDQGPFTMTIQSVKVTDGTLNASSYSYQGHSGNWQSIKITEGQSTASQKIHAPPPLTVRQRWNQLPTGAKIAIVCGSVAVAAILLGILTYCCIKRRKQGRKERALLDAQWDRDEAELLEHKRRWANGEYGKGPIIMTNVSPKATW